MALYINSNLTSLNAQRNLGINNSKLSKTLERLSSGLRINRAADDAAGLAISEKLRTQIKGLNQATSNAQDGVHLVQTAEGGLEQISGILQRMRELSIQAANDTLVNEDRGKIQAEINQLRTEITRISQTTEFNTRKLLNGSIQSSQTDFQNARAVLTNNIRVGDAQNLPLDIRNFVAGIQSLALNATVDQAISLKIVNLSSSLPEVVGLEVRSSVYGLLTQIQDLPTLGSTSFGISLLGPSNTSSLLTLDINKGGYISGITDRSTPLSSLILTERLSPVNAGNMSLTVGSTAYSIAVDPNTDTINSLLAKINALSNASHTFSATYDDVNSRFQISVSRTSNPPNIYTATTNYSSTPPAAYSGGTPAPAPYPGFTLPAVGTLYASVVDFPDLNALNQNTDFTLNSTGGNLTALFGGVTTVNRQITAYSTNTYTGTATATGVNSNYDLTSTLDFSSISSNSRTQSNASFAAGNTWGSYGLAAADTLQISVQTSSGGSYTASIVVNPGDTVGASLTALQTDLNTNANGGGDNYAVFLGVGGNLVVSHDISQNYAAGVASLTKTLNNYIPPNAPIPFGGTTGPNNFGPGSPGINAFYPNPGGVAPEFDLSLSFGGSTGLQQALYLNTLADNADTRSNTYAGAVTSNGGDSYTLTTTQTEIHNPGNNSTQSAIAVGGPFNLTEADIGKEVMVQIFAERKEVREDRSLTLQIGANEGQFLKLGIDEMSSHALRIETLNIWGANDQDSHLKAQNAIGVLTEALDQVNLQRSRLGALQNRLEYTIQNLQISRENLTASESRIRDADIAMETAQLTRSQILVQAGTAVLSQANSAPQSALNLLRG